MKQLNFRLLMILTGGLLLRCLAIQTRGIEYDDAFSIFLSEKSLSSIINGTAADTMPPGYYFLLHFWMQFGGEVWIIRLLGIILSLVSMVFLFLIIKSLVSENAGLWAVLLAAISPFQIYHAQDIRNYSLLLTSQIIFIYFFVRLWKRVEISRQHWLWIGLILSGAMALYAHNLAVFMLVIPLFFLLVQRKWKFLFQTITALFCVVVLFIPWLVVLPGQMDKIQRAFWTPRPGIVEIIQVITIFTATLPLPGWLLYVAVTMSIEILVILSIQIIRDWKLFPEIKLLVYLTVIPLILMFLISYLIRPVFVARGAIASSMFLYGLVGAVISNRWKTIPAYLILFGFLVNAAISLPYQTLYDRFPRSPFQKAMADLSKDVPSDGIILHNNKLSYFPSKYYAPNIPQAFLADVPGSGNDTLALGSQEAMGIFPVVDVQSAVKDKTQVDYVIFENVIQEYKDNGGTKDPNMTWLYNNFNLSDEKKYNDLVIYKFSK